MVEGFHVILVNGRRRHNYGIRRTRSLAEDLAKCLYMQFPRRWDCHVEIVDSRTGEVTTM